MTYTAPTEADRCPHCLCLEGHLAKCIIAPTSELIQAVNRLQQYGAHAGTLKLLFLARDRAVAKVVA